MVVPAISILGASLCASALSEFLSWLLFYRGPEYAKLKGSFAKTEKKLEALAAINAKSKKKKDQRQEEQLKASLRAGLGSVRMKTGLLTGALLFVFYQILTSVYDGQPVAKLPFVPVPFIARFTHRNVPGTDFSEASVTFVYALCSMCLRAIVSKVFNLGPSKRMSALVQGESPLAKAIREHDEKTS